MFALGVLPISSLGTAEAQQPSEAASANGESRRPANERELQFWLENMVWRHHFSMAEMRAATGMSQEELASALKKFDILTDNNPRRRDDSSPLDVLPYPGGRHPRIGFRDGAVNPQRETKVSIFTPWDDSSYVVADVPEAIWSNLGLTYLAHSHVPTIWTKKNIELEKLEWRRFSDSTLFLGPLSLERKLPNGISFSTKFVADRSVVWFEMTLTNGTSETLSDLRVQNCVMLAHAKEFEQQTNDNKVFAATKTPGSPYVAVHNADRTRWIISAWDPVHRPWANPPCPCLHSDPKFPDCEPGKTRFVRGLVTFHDGTDIEAKFKELDGVGWRREVPPESAEGRRQRQERVASRRVSPAIICHRGASDFAHENTLEAYRATFELGADGNEIDIRETKDGVLVCFHDDMLDQILAAYGDVSDYTWNELSRFRFRRPGPFGMHTRIPTLAEVFELHRKYAGLMHLDIKRPVLDHKIAQMLDQFDLWEHVMSAPAENGQTIVKDARYKPLKYKAQLYSDHRDVDTGEIETAMKLEGTALILDDPRAAIVVSGRNLGAVSREPASPHKAFAEHENTRPADRRDFYDAWIAMLDMGKNAELPANAAQAALGELPILLRAGTADVFATEPTPWVRANPRVYPALEALVRQRQLNPEWRLHGLDGAAALRALFKHKAPGTVDLARESIWRDDPALDKVRDPKFNNPRSWHDWRIKNIVFPLLEMLPGEKTEKVCRDYLTLSDDEARKIGPPQFDAAAKTLLTVSPNEETALELLKHRHPGVRNRAVKVCLQHASEAWAIAALKQASPDALKYIPPRHTEKPADE